MKESEETPTLEHQFKESGKWFRLSEKRRQAMDTFLRDSYPKRYRELLRLYFQNLIEAELNKKKG